MSTPRLPAAVTAPQAAKESYFDAFVGDNSGEILNRLDGPNGFFAKAEAKGMLGQLDPKLEGTIDRTNRLGLDRLGITKREIGLIFASFKGGQKRSLLETVNVPSVVVVQNGYVHASNGKMKTSIHPQTGQEVIPRGRFNKADGSMWLIPSRYEELYTDPSERRVAALWGITHEFTHSVAGRRVIEAVAGQPGQSLILPNGTRTDSTTFLRASLTSHFPATPITERSGYYRQPDGSMSTETSKFRRAVEEEMCETVAAGVMGFAPTPGVPASEAFNRPFAGRAEFRADVRAFMQAAA